jgi:4-hydroxy-4-methyl-2-oxoglutarate aldolase
VTDPTLDQLDSCALSDACDTLHIDPPAITGLGNLTGRRRIAGRAVTVLLGPPTGEPSTRHLCTTAIEAAGPGDVIVVAHQGRLDCAGWGGNLSRAAQGRGVEGTIVDGAMRDVDEAADIAYPVFATGATPRTARRRTQEHAWNVPVEIAGVTVNPGDLIVADATGIIVIAAEHSQQVIATAVDIVAKEAAMAADIAAGIPVSTVMGTNYEHLEADTSTSA